MPILRLPDQTIRLYRIVMWTWVLVEGAGPSCLC